MKFRSAITHPYGVVVAIILAVAVVYAASWGWTTYHHRQDVQAAHDRGVEAFVCGVSTLAQARQAGYDCIIGKAK